MSESVGIMICCKCKKEISEGDLFCRFCGARQSIAEPKAWNSFDAVKLDFGKYSSIPAIIQEEYGRLFSLLEEGQNYGAVLQMRDVYEICLKLPVIISMAYICSKERFSEAEYKVIDTIIERELSCGAWHEIARMLIKTVDQNVLVQILNEADELWSWDGRRGMRGRRNSINGYTGFAHWRNSTIGHGALAFDSQEDYFSQFERMLSKLNDYCIHSYAAFSCIEFGKENMVAINDKKYKLSPFVVSDFDGLYFFDAYLYGKKKYDILNYQNAKKNSYRQDKEEEQQLEALYRDTKGFLTTLVSTSKMDADNNSIYSDWHSLQEEELLENTIMAKEYHRVNYLTEWALKALKDNKFALLSMESGLGKSSWCRTFDERFCNSPETISGYDVKVIYINRFYNKSADSILSAVQDCLSLSPNGQKVIKFDNPRYINRKAENKRKEFAEVLNFYYEKMHQVGAWQEEKLLLIFDGLDELSDPSFWEWLPESADINDGIRILFTARANDSFVEIKSDLERNLNTSFTKDNFITITNDSKDNIDLLSRYIMEFGHDNHIDFTENDIRTLLLKSKNKFLYLSGLLQIVNKENLSIPQEDNSYIFLLDYLRKMYSDKYFHDIEGILGMLTVISVPVSMRELSQILGYETPNYLLASYIKDLMPFLVIEYKQGEAYYSIAHDEVISAIQASEWFSMDEILTLLKNCVMDSAEQLTRIEREQLLRLENEDFKGSIYVLLHMDILPKLFAGYFNEKELQKLLNGWCDVCSWISDVCIYSHLDPQEKFKIYKNIYDLCETLFEDKRYLLFESYLKMRLLSPEFIGYYGYTEESLKNDEALTALLAGCLRSYEERDMSTEDRNIYDRELMIYPALAGRVALKGILQLKETRGEYENKLADALKFAAEMLEAISENPGFCRHDIQFVKTVIRELSSNAYTLVDKKILQKNGIQDIKEYILDAEYESFEYGDLYKKSMLLNMEGVKYIQGNAKIPNSLLHEANELYDLILAELDNTSDRRAKYCLVSYFPPIVVIYKLLCANGTGSLSCLSKDNSVMIDRIIKIFDYYDQYGFVSHEIHHYINALVTYGISEFNAGNKETAVTYLKKTIHKYEHYKKQPYYREQPEILGDVCNAYYTLALYYGAIGEENKMKKNLKEAQAIYRNHPAVKKMFAMAPGMCAHLEGRPAQTPQIKKVKIGRNDPCPCGSGKKYKKCCGV